jgi:uncharacterized membrane protein
MVEHEAMSERKLSVRARRAVALAAALAVTAATAPAHAARGEAPLPADAKAKTGGGPAQPPAGPNDHAPQLTPCALSDIGLSAGVCHGWVQGNFNNGDPASRAYVASVLNTLTGGNAFSGPSLTWSEDKAGPQGAPAIDFNATLYGRTILAVHVGAATGQANAVGYQSTAWYVFDAGATGIDVLAFNRPGFSNARLFSTGEPPGACLVCNAVPEPSTWAMMIIGFGAVGHVIRRRRWSHRLA